MFNFLKKLFDQKSKKRTIGYTHEMYLKQKKLDDEWWELAYKIEAESNVRWGKVINDLYKEVESSNSKEEANSKIQLANELQEMMNVYNTKFQTLSNNYYSLPSNNKNNQILPA